MLQKYIKVNGKQYLQQDLAFLAVGAAGIVIARLVQKLTCAMAGEMVLETVPAGTLCFLAAWILLKIFPRQDLVERYKGAVFMNCTRKSFLQAEVLCEFLNNSFLALLSFGLYRFEQMFCSRFYTEAAKGFDLDQLYQWKMMISLVVVLSVMPTFLTGLYMVRKWIPWIIWMLCCWCVPICARRFGASFNELKESVLQMPAYGILLAAAGISAVFLLVGWRLMYKREVPC